MPLSAYPCLCCGYLVFDEPPGSYAICPICYWEDDAGQQVHPDAGGANAVSLRLAQRSYRECGACEARFAHLVREPIAADTQAPGWHPLDSPRPAIRGLRRDWPSAPWARYYWLSELLRLWYGVPESLSANCLGSVFSVADQSAIIASLARILD